MKLSYPVGTKYVYSDISMVFMQLVIEKVAGMGLDQFTQKYVFAPMNMSLTLYNPGAPYRQRNQCAPTEIYNNVSVSPSGLPAKLFLGRNKKN